MTKLKNKSYVFGIICILILSSLVALPTKGKNYVPLENNKDINTLSNTLSNVVPDYVRLGDLYFCDVKIRDNEPGWDHVGIYIGNNEFIEAVPGGVWITNLSKIETWATDITYGAVITSNETQRQNAIAFAESQLGKPYDPCKNFLIWWYDRPKDSSPDAEAWYCSELVWAAYYNQGIDIDKSGDRPPHVSPTEISSDDNVEMYTSHKFNSYYKGIFIEWLINRILKSH